MSIIIKNRRQYFLLFAVLLLVFALIALLLGKDYRYAYENCIENGYSQDYCRTILE